MLVTCKICGNKIERNEAYKVTTISPTSGKPYNKYYCSEAEYQAKKKKTEDHYKVLDLIDEILGAKILNTAVCKEKAIWNTAFSDEIIIKYLEENKEELTKAISRASDSEYARIRYLSAFLKNNLRDFKPKAEVQEAPKIVVEEHYETKYKAKSRQALEDFEEDDDE